MYVRPGTEEEWAEKCGESYIPVGARQYAAELGSDSDEANDAKARRRNCMTQRMEWRLPRYARKAPTPAATRAPEPHLEPPLWVCCPQCRHTFQWPPLTEAPVADAHGEAPALQIITGGF